MEALRDHLSWPERRECGSTRNRIHSGLENSIRLSINIYIQVAVAASSMQRALFGCIYLHAEIVRLSISG